MSILREDSLSFSDFNNANCYAVSCLMERVIHQGKGSPSPTSNKKLRPSLVACNELNASNNHVNLEADPSPGKSQMKLQPHQHPDYSFVEALTQRTQRNWARLLTHRNCEIKKRVLLIAKFVVILLHSNNRQVIRSTFTL